MGGHVVHNDNHWDELSKDMKLAAMTLGYNKPMWEDDFDLYYENLREEYKKLNWMELSPNAQNAATVLGFTPELWDDGIRLSKIHQDWNTLSKFEQQAALTLGWDERLWCEDKDLSSF